jgi:hypothetical protein
MAGMPQDRAETWRQSGRLIAAAGWHTRRFSPVNGASLHFFLFPSDGGRVDRPAVLRQIAPRNRGFDPIGLHRPERPKPETSQERPGRNALSAAAGYLDRRLTLDLPHS